MIVTPPGIALHTTLLTNPPSITLSLGCKDRKNEAMPIPQNSQIYKCCVSKGYWNVAADLNIL